MKYFNTPREERTAPVQPTPGPLTKNVPMVDHLRYLQEMDDKMLTDMVDVFSRCNDKLDLQAIPQGEFEQRFDTLIQRLDYYRALAGGGSLDAKV